MCGTTHQTDRFIAPHKNKPRPLLPLPPPFMDCTHCGKIPTVSPHHHHPSPPLLDWSRDRGKIFPRTGPPSHPARSRTGHLLRRARVTTPSPPLHFRVITRSWGIFPTM
ncbi:hypothetical protein F2P79_026056, partial [Pimephales promelas]